MVVYEAKTPRSIIILIFLFDKNDVDCVVEQTAVLSGCYNLIKTMSKSNSHLENELDLQVSSTK